MMRWIFFGMLAYLLVLMQTTGGRILLIEDLGLGTVGPDLLAALAVWCVLYAFRASDAVLAACVLGLVLDLTTAGVGGSRTVVGPMVFGYAFAARLLYAVRDAFFRDRASTRLLMTFLFVLVAHGIWVCLQALFAPGGASWNEFARTLLQAVAVAAYSAVVGWALILLIDRARGWLLLLPAGRSRQR
jgi:cell shape-determining protein MreD